MAQPNYNYQQGQNQNPMYNMNQQMGNMSMGNQPPGRGPPMQQQQPPRGMMPQQPGRGPPQANMQQPPQGMMQNQQPARGPPQSNGQQPPRGMMPQQAGRGPPQSNMQQQPPQGMMQQQQPGRGPPQSNMQQPGHGPPQSNMQQPPRGMMPPQSQQNQPRGPPQSMQPQARGPAPQQSMQQPRGPPQSQQPGRGPAPQQSMQQPGRGPPQSQQPGRGPPQPNTNLANNNPFMNNINQPNTSGPPRGPPSNNSTRQRQGSFGAFPNAVSAPPTGNVNMNNQPHMDPRQLTQQTTRMQATNMYPTAQATGPPMPGQGMPNQGGAPMNDGNLPPGQKQRINPQQIPRPKWQNNYNKPLQPFRTRINNVRGGQPTFIPGALDRFMAIDEGCANPRYMRMTLNQVPNTYDLLNTSKAPCAVIVHPFADLEMGELPPKTVTTGALGPQRCSRCRGYLNPFCRMEGHYWKCNLCDMQNEATAQNYGLYGHSGNPTELTYGSVDFIVEGDYIARPLQEPLYVFCIDVTNASITSGIFSYTLETIKSILYNIDIVGGDRARIGILTYDTSVHFYDLSSDSPDNIRMLIVPDADDMFCPLPPSSWIVNVKKKKEHLDALFTLISSQFKSSDIHRSIAGSAVKAAYDGLRQDGGKIMLFHTSIPTLGMGKLTDRDLLNLYGTETEATIYTPLQKDDYYKNLAQALAESYICVDMFCSAASFTDIGTMGQISNMTGGTIYKYSGDANYPSFRTKFADDLTRNLTRDVALEAVLKVRCSQGLRVSEYLGCGMKRKKGGELDACNIDADKSIAVILEHDGTQMMDNTDGYLQCAILYTSPTGDRRVRVHNISFTVTATLSEVFRYSDVDAVTNVLSRLAAADVQASKPVPAVRKKLTDDCVNILHAYRKNCASATSSGQLILPEALKLLPLFMIGVIKHDVLQMNGRTNNWDTVAVRGDNRALALHLVQHMSVKAWTRMLYPSLFCLTELPENAGKLGEIPSLPQPNQSQPQSSMPQSQMQPGMPQVNGQRANPFGHNMQQPMMMNPGQNNMMNPTNPPNNMMNPMNPPNSMMNPMQMQPNSNQQPAPETDTPVPAVEKTIKPIEASIVLPEELAPTAASVKMNGIYLLDDGMDIMVYLASDAPPDRVQQLFGMPIIQSGATNMALQPLDNDYSRRIFAIIQELRSSRTPTITTTLPSIVVVPNKSILEAKFMSKLVEDKTGQDMSYISFLCHVHKMIQGKLAESH